MIGPPDPGTIGKVQVAVSLVFQWSFFSFILPFLVRHCSVYLVVACIFPNLSKTGVFYLFWGPFWPATCSSWFYLIWYSFQFYVEAFSSIVALTGIAGMIGWAQSTCFYWACSIMTFRFDWWDSDTFTSLDGDLQISVLFSLFKLFLFFYSQNPSFSPFLFVNVPSMIYAWTLCSGTA